MAASPPGGSEGSGSVRLLSAAAVCAGRVARWRAHQTSVRATLVRFQTAAGQCFPVLLALLLICSAAPHLSEPDLVQRPYPEYSPAHHGTGWLRATRLTPIGRPASSRLPVLRYVRSGRFFRTRCRYDSKATATYQCCRLLQIAGDVELNPGPPPGDRPITSRARPTRLSALLHNTQSLRGKLGLLRASAEELKGYDIVAFTETWLDDSVGEAELSTALPEHSWFRRDRGGVGGGVACAVRSSLQPTRRTDPDHNTETVIVHLGLPNITVAVCYRPPSDDPALERLGQCLSALPNARPLLVLGDFNVPELQWEPRLGGGTQPVFVRNSARATKFTDSCDVLGLTQFVSMPTRCRNVLDLVLARGFIDVTALPRPSTIVSDHDEVVISLNVKSPPPTRATRAAAFNYRRADFDGLRRAL